MVTTLGERAFVVAGPYERRRRLAPDERLCQTVVLVEPAIELLDIVALLESLPEHGVRRGRVGTVVETRAPDVFEVEFSDDRGCTYASRAIEADWLMPLHHAPTLTAEPCHTQADASAYLPRGASAARNLGCLASG